RVRPPGALTHAHTHAPAAIVGERYLFMTGGDAPEDAKAADEYDLFAWAGASNTTFPLATQTLASQVSNVLAIGDHLADKDPMESGAIWFDGTTFSSP